MSLRQASNPPDFRGRRIVKDHRQSPLFHAVAESMRTILEANSKPNYHFMNHFNVLSNPEFLAEGTAIDDLFAPDRILIGSLQTPEGKDACASLAGVYANCVPTEQILTVGLWSFELSKLAANAMLEQRISINALSAICETTGANIRQRRRKDIVNLVYSESLRLPEVAACDWRRVVEMNEYQKRRFSKRVVELWNCLDFSLPLLDAFFQG
ncbi:hypothetical protein B0H11DRAFT_2261225 [Mycena galericulata]|nr:hypothetical protein B0H11DRAFT_2261225 [Mycena galericulata]